MSDLDSVISTKKRRAPVKKLTRRNNSSNLSAQMLMLGMNLKQMMKDKQKELENPPTNKKKTLFEEVPSDITSSIDSDSVSSEDEFGNPK